MPTKIPCTKCGTEILPSTAEATGGLCMPCQQGFREEIEAAKVRNAAANRYDPFFELWKSLVERVHHTSGGCEALTKDERLIYVVNSLLGEVPRGGMYAFFDNYPAAVYREALAGLQTLGAPGARALLLRAKDILFGDLEPPDDDRQRAAVMKSYSDDDDLTPDWEQELERIEEEFLADSELLGEKFDQFVEQSGLLQPFLRD